MADSPVSGGPYAFRVLSLSIHPMTVRLDADGSAYSDLTCLRCEQAGPHWLTRSEVFACRRCFATFKDSQRWFAGDGLARL